MEQNFKYLTQTQRYITFMRRFLTRGPLFSDETRNYVCPMEPKTGDTIKIRFRTAKDNVDFVFFISGTVKNLMRLEKSEGEFDYYTTEIVAEKTDLLLF